MFQAQSCHSHFSTRTKMPVEINMPLLISIIDAAVETDTTEEYEHRVEEIAVSGEEKFNALTAEEQERYMQILRNTMYFVNKFEKQSKFAKEVLKKQNNAFKQPLEDSEVHQLLKDKWIGQVNEIINDITEEIVEKHYTDMDDRINGEIEKLADTIDKFTEMLKDIL